MKTAVVGGGVTGLAAAFFLAQQPEMEVTVFESDSRMGGKVQAEELGDLSVEMGPDSFVTRSAAIFEIISEIGLGDLLIHPKANRALILRGGSLRTLPQGLNLGFPTNSAQILKSEVLTPLEKLSTYLRWRLQRDADFAKSSDDIGRILEYYVGRPYVRYVLDPLIGGINAASVYGASGEITASQILRLLRGEPQVTTTTDHTQMPPFASFEGGLSVLIGHMQEYLKGRGVALRTNSVVSDLKLTSNGVMLETDLEVEEFDKVILTTPPSVTGILLRDISPETAQILRSIRRASVTMSTLLVDADLTHIPSDVAGVLVPRDQGFLTTAITLGPNKWPEWRSNAGQILRISSGRFGEGEHLKIRPDELVSLLIGEAQEILGTHIGLLDYRVKRWVGSFVRFAPYHRQLMNKVEKTLAADSKGAIELSGSFVRGSGIPTCIQVAKEVASRTQSSRL